METTLLDVLGIRTIEVAGLPEPGILLRQYDLALVEADLTPGDRAVLIDRLFALATGLA